MSAPVRRNSSKPFIDYRLKRDKAISDNKCDQGIPNVMTSPAIFPIGSSDTDRGTHKPNKNSLFCEGAVWCFFVKIFV